MVKLLLKTNIKRESGKLYFCKTGSNGNIEICEAVMARGGKKKSKRKKK